MRVTTFAFILCVAAGSAHAAIYENLVNVDGEDDLLELQQRGDISDETAETLLELIREGVDLNSATREQLYDLPGLTYADVDAILEYRKATGRIGDPAELVGSGALTAEQVVQLAPFIRIDAAAPLLPVSGAIHAATRFTTTDNVPPPALLSARLKGPYQLSAGFMMFTTRRRAASPTYAPVTDALTSRGFTYQPQLPRIFAQWKPGNARLVVGTFTIGFAERLTLDDTRRVTPRGIYLSDDYTRGNDLTQTCKLSYVGVVEDPTSGCDLSSGKNLYITPDYTWRDSFRGVAGSIEDLKVGKEATLSMYGFLSYQQRSIYQYDLYDHRACDDPRADQNPQCASPPVYLPDGTTRLAYSTLSNVFDELTGGGHVTFKPSYQLTFGVTGFGAAPFFRQAPMHLDFQESSRYPSGGAFGALGVDAHASFKGINFFLEATHNFDKRVGTASAGGYGVEQRTTFSPKNQEFELSLRFYDQGFGTPYARPIASPDLLEGQRARNEVGARFKWLGRLSREWAVRLAANFWVNPWANVIGVPTIDPNPTSVVMPAGVPNLYLLARVDFTGWRIFQPSLWLDLRNRNLPAFEHGLCASGTIVVLADGEPFTCGGDSYKVAARFDIAPMNRLLSAAMQASFSWKDDIKYKDRFRNEVQVWAEARSTPVDFLQLRVRARYLNQDLSDVAYLEKNVWTFIEGAWLITPKTRLALRYDLFVWLDQRASTLNRLPNPEHRFQLDVRTSF